MDSAESNKIWEKLVRQNKIDEFIQIQNRISNETDRRFFSGSVKDAGLVSKHKELIHQLMMIFHNAIIKNREENIFSYIINETEDLKFEIEDLMCIEKAMTIQLGYKFEVRRFANENKILIKVNTKNIFRWD
ncbi:hypothetical protein [Flavobacterium facile]|uniref:hypothetical protein n=1 Tax=Flavobacterium facile TaxID=2893174 RepID=UPI002E799EA6|nr:hypothetical protein [Flavobacterium sp. T-12]